MRSKLLDELYGLQESTAVYNTLEALDPKLNEIVQVIAYDYFWALPGLTTKEKSFVTVISLLSMQKEAQTRPHLLGFLNSGGTATEIAGSLVHLSNFLSIESVKKGLNALCDILIKINAESTMIDTIKNLFDLELKKDHCEIINSKSKHLINIVYSVSLGNLENTKISIRNFLKENNSCENELRNILIHLVVYCGFPSAINGFNALNAVLKES